MDINALSEGALIKHPTQGLLLGVGPFTESAEPPEEGVAFYVNTFRLDDPKPWKIPAEVIRLTEPTEELPPAPAIRWSEPAPDAYAQVFTEIIEQIATGKLIKTVPGTPQFGELMPPHRPQELVTRALRSPLHHYPYAWWNDESGFCGATPEILFHRQREKITTMALAGTARAEEESVFINDEKEIREHEIVAGTILSRLSPCGTVKRSPRSVLNLGSIIHFLSHISLEADAPMPPDYWIRLLHPTPALGSKPRTEQTMAQLDDWRARLRCPAHFGAPFGIAIDGECFCLVGIRSISWKGHKLALCTGGGVVASSTLTYEWRELKLKREKVKNSLHLT